MSPIVNGLAQDNDGKANVLVLDASAEGQKAFDFYRMTGHPSYLLLAPDGTRLWSGIGLLSRNELAARLERAVAEGK